MEILDIILFALVVGAATFIVTYALLSVDDIKADIRKRREKKADQKVVFGETRKLVNENAQEILKKAPKMTMEELEELCDEKPYFMVDYDDVKEEASNMKLYQVKETTKSFDDLMREHDGVLKVFD